MPITSSAKKAHRASLAKRVYNVRRLRALRETLKEARKLAESGQVDKAQELLPHAYKVIDKAAKRGVIKSNTASRYKSRLVHFIKKKKRAA